MNENWVTLACTFFYSNTSKHVITRPQGWNGRSCALRRPQIEDLPGDSSCKDLSSVITKDLHETTLPSKTIKNSKTATVGQLRTVLGPNQGFWKATWKSTILHSSPLLMLSYSWIFLSDISLWPPESHSGKWGTASDGMTCVHTQWMSQPYGMQCLDTWEEKYNGPCFKVRLTFWYVEC